MTEKVDLHAIVLNARESLGVERVLRIMRSDNIRSYVTIEFRGEIPNLQVFQDGSTSSLIAYDDRLRVAIDRLLSNCIHKDIKLIEGEPIIDGMRAHTDHVRTIHMNDKQLLLIAYAISRCGWQGHPDIEEVHALEAMCKETAQTEYGENGRSCIHSFVL